MPALRQALDVATTEERLVAQIAAQAAHPGGERAAAWLLERKYPQRWGAADAGARIGARGRRRRAIAQGAAMVDVGAGPTDEQLIAGAVAEARAAGVRNSEIARVMDEAAALDDDLTIALVGGRLYRLPREVERATSA